MATSEEIAEILRLREANPRSSDLSDIYQYIDNRGTSFAANEPVTGGEQGMGSSFTEPWQTITHGAGDNAWQEVVPVVDPRFAEGITFGRNSTNGEGSSGWNTTIDDSKFPRTSLGTGVSQTAPVNDYSDLFNPNLVVDDPNYGRISPESNFKPDKLNTTVQQALMAAAVGAFGMAPGMPGFITPAISAARSLGSGADPMSIIMSLASSYIPGAAGLTGIPAQLVQAALRTAVQGGKIDPTAIALMLARAGINLSK